jgi:hypothetical protein
MIWIVAMIATVIWAPWLAPYVAIVGGAFSMINAASEEPGECVGENGFGYGLSSIFYGFFWMFFGGDVSALLHIAAGISWLLLGELVDFVWWCIQVERCRAQNKTKEKETVL